MIHEPAFPNSSCPSRQPKKKAKASKGKGKKKGGGGKKKGKKSGSTPAEKKNAPVADPLSHAAMVNAYYISHGPVEFLAFRGYTWPGAGAGTKKKKGGGKKKKK